MTLPPSSIGWAIHQFHGVVLGLAYVAHTRYALPVTIGHALLAGE